MTAWSQMLSRRSVHTGTCSGITRSRLGSVNYSAHEAAQSVMHAARHDQRNVQWKHSMNAGSLLRQVLQTRLVKALTSVSEFMKRCLLTDLPKARGLLLQEVPLLGF